MPLSPSTSSRFLSPPDLFNQAMGIKGLNFGLPVTGAASNQTPVSQRLYACPVAYRAGLVVSNVGIVLNTAGAGTTPTTIKVAIATFSDKKVQAVSANEAGNAAWTAAGIGMRSVPLLVPYQIPTDGIYWHYWLQDGTWGTTQIVWLRGTTIGGGGQVNGTGAFVMGQLDGQTDIVVGSTPALTSAGIAMYSFST